MTQMEESELWKNTSEVMVVLAQAKINSMDTSPHTFIPLVCGSVCVKSMAKQ